MYLTKAIALLGFLLCSLSLMAQFKGGIGQGTKLISPAAASTLGISFFKGGNDDGTVLIAPATTQPLGISFFKGGNDDGTVLTASTTTKALGVSFFKGGNDDGTVLTVPATTQPLGISFYKGGNDDGTVLTAPAATQPLGNSFFKGGRDDGFAMAFAANVPLPVTLISFDAAWAKDDVVTKWKTTSEINTAYFEIERGIDGNNFKTIGKIAASGNSSTTKNYTYTDVGLKAQINPLPDRLYYRLKTFDSDGKWQYSAIVVLTTQKQNTIVYTLYPNPANRQLVIESKGLAASRYDIKLLSANSQMLMQKTMTMQRETLDVSMLASGIYYVLITEAENKTTQTFKIIIQH